MLRALRLALATGKSLAGVERVFNATGCGHLFEAIQTADTNFSKPNPRMLFAIADESGLEPSEMVMIGDSVLDLQMASNAGVQSLGVEWGASPVTELEKHASLGVARSVSELADRLGLIEFLDKNPAQNR